MAVTQSSDRSSGHQMDKEVQPSPSEEADAGPLWLNQLRSNPCGSSGQGSSARYYQHLNKDCRLVKRYKPVQSCTKSYRLESIPDIDDIEVAGYFNNKEDMEFKKTLWEAMNKNFTRPKKQKRTIEAKEAFPVKKANKTDEKVVVKKPNSRINYDALKSLGIDLN